MKKLVCILFTLVMVMSLSITAFATEDNGFKEVESLTAENTQDITITNTINKGEGSVTSERKYYVTIKWNLYLGEITIDRSDDYYEWNPANLKYILSGESNYDLSYNSDGTTRVCFQSVSQA